jgi:hypothetical protein
MRDDDRRPKRPEESKVKMVGAKTTKKTLHNNNRKGMPVKEWRKDGVAPFNTPPTTTCEPIQYSGNYDGNDGEDVGDIF